MTAKEMFFKEPRPNGGYLSYGDAKMILRASESVRLRKCFACGRMMETHELRYEYWQDSQGVNHLVYIHITEE